MILLDAAWRSVGAFFYERIQRVLIALYRCVRASALLWQGRMQAMTELVAPIIPSTNLWTQIGLALAGDLRTDYRALPKASSQSVTG